MEERRQRNNESHEFTTICHTHRESNSLQRDSTALRLLELNRRGVTPTISSLFPWRLSFVDTRHRGPPVVIPASRDSVCREEPITT